jgi:hypothetical protein
MAMVTQESDPTTWDKLYAQWLSEGRPVFGYNQDISCW